MLIAKRETGAEEGLILDIGDSIGALVVEADESFLGREIEVSLSPADATAPRTHADVLERRLGSRRVFAAVFVALEEGDYALWDGSGEPAGTVAIRGGEVAEYQLV
jgi:hypothetical protein